MLWPFARLVWAVSLVLPLLSLAHDHQGKRHHVHRQGDLALRDITCTGSRFTYFADGLGACGSQSQPSDFIVALNTAQFNQALCFQSITITVNGITQTATIVDKCPGCPPCGLDFSTGLFQAFAPLTDGVLTGDWNLGSGGGGGGSSPPPSAPPPAPSTTSVETPTTSLLPSPTTTSQPSPTTTSSTTSSKTTGSSSSSMVPTQTTTNGVPEPSGATPGGSSVLLALDLYLLSFAGVLESCSSSQ